MKKSYYEIIVEKHIPRKRASFENMNLTLLDNGDTLISGEITDQSELLGILRQICEMNLMLKKLEKKEGVII